MRAHTHTHTSHTPSKTTFITVISLISVSTTALTGYNLTLTSKQLNTRKQTHTCTHSICISASLESWDDRPRLGDVVMSMFTVPFCSDRCLSKIWCVIKQSSWVWGRFITVLRETQGLQKHLKLHGVCAVKDKTLTHPVNSESPLWDLSLAWGSYGKQQSQEIIFCELIFTCNIINITFWCDWLTFNSNSEILSCIVFEL